MAKLEKKYADALFALALERGVLAENLQQAQVVRDTLADDECRQIMKHPRISTKEKKSFVDEAFKGKIHNDILGFLHLAIEKNREKFIVPVLDEFISMGNVYSRKTTALVVSAVPLRKEQISALTALLSKKLDKQVDIEQRINPAIIGGLFIQVDGYYIDRTIRSGLQDIKESLIVEV